MFAGGGGQKLWLRHCIMTKTVHSKPEGHIVVLGAPAPVEVRVAVDALKMFRAHVEHSADQLLIRQPATRFKCLHGLAPKAGISPLPGGR